MYFKTSMATEAEPSTPRTEPKAGRPPDPYYTPWEQNLNREREARKRFVGGNFIVTDHKAVVDLVRIVNDLPSKDNYRGIGW